MKRKIRFTVACLLILLLVGICLWQRFGKAPPPREDRPIHGADASAAATQGESSKPGDYQSPIDFKTLHETNADIYAWIEVPGTDIAYPIVQHPEDDFYYLDHTVEGASGLPGSIFTCADDPGGLQSFNTVIYGHNMKNGSMFGGLKEYRDLQYFQEHRLIRIYTPEQQLDYKVYAAVIYDDRYIPGSFDEREERGRKKFLESIRSVRDLNSYVAEDMEVDVDDHLITLSTCIRGQPDNRYLVVAVLEKNE